MSRYLVLLCTFSILVAGCSRIEDRVASQRPSKHNYEPIEGVVPDEVTATKLADVILRRAYGEAVIGRELPLSATLRSDGIWVVKGTWQYSSGDRGGVAVIEIAKKDGRVIRLTHGM